MLPPARSAPFRSIFEADVPLHQNPAATLDAMRTLGADTVRVFMPWGFLGALGAVAPDANAPRPPAGFNGSDPAAYPSANWAIWDTIVRDAQARGMTVDLTLGPPPPLWARGPGDPGHPPHPQWRLNVSAFGQWVHAVTTRYSGHYRDPRSGIGPLPRVDMWAIWNEPNFGPMVAPQTTPQGVDVSPVTYRRMVDVAYSALRATGHAADTILIGELAPYGHALGPAPGRFGYMVPLRFLRSLYCVGPGLRPLTGVAAAQIDCPSGGAGFRAAHPGLFDASALSLHPYAQGPPSASAPGQPDYANLPAVPHVEATIDSIFRVYGSSRQIPLFSTEFGVHTNPPETVFGTVSPQQATIYMNQAEYLSWRDPRLRSYGQYLLADGPRGVFATGLEFNNGQPKPGYGAYQMPLFLPVTQVRPDESLEVWGGARPARYAGASSRQVELQFRPAGAAAFRALRAVMRSPGSPYFDLLQRFTGAGSVRTAWRAPGGQLLFSRTVQLTSH